MVDTTRVPSLTGKEWKRFKRKYKDFQKKHGIPVAPYRMTVRREELCERKYYTY